MNRIFALILALSILITTHSSAYQGGGASIPPVPLSPPFPTTQQEAATLFGFPGLLSADPQYWHTRTFTTGLTIWEFQIWDDPRSTTSFYVPLGYDNTCYVGDRAGGIPASGPTIRDNYWNCAFWRVNRFMFVDATTWPSTNVLAARLFGQPGEYSSQPGQWTPCQSDPYCWYLSDSVAFSTTVVNVPLGASLEGYISTGRVSGVQILSDGPDSRSVQRAYVRLTTVTDRPILTVWPTSAADAQNAFGVRGHASQRFPEYWQLCPGEPRCWKSADGMAESAVFIRKGTFAQGWDARNKENVYVEGLWIGLFAGVTIRQQEPTPTATSTPTATGTPTATPTATPVVTGTVTPTAIPTVTVAPTKTVGPSSFTASVPIIITERDPKEYIRPQVTKENWPRDNAGAVVMFGIANERSAKLMAWKPCGGEDFCWTLLEGSSTDVVVPQGATAQGWDGTNPIPLTDGPWHRYVLGVTIRLKF